MKPQSEILLFRVCHLILQALRMLLNERMGRGMVRELIAVTQEVKQAAYPEGYPDTFK